MAESHDDQLCRVVEMASGSPAWDLSDEDLAALRTVLRDRETLLRWLKRYVEGKEGHANEARIAIGEAEGKQMTIELPISKEPSL